MRDIEKYFKWVPVPAKFDKRRVLAYVMDNHILGRTVVDFTTMLQHGSYDVIPNHFGPSKWDYNGPNAMIAFERADA